MLTNPVLGHGCASECPWMHGRVRVCMCACACACVCVCVYGDLSGYLPPYYMYKEQGWGDAPEGN